MKGKLFLSDDELVEKELEKKYALEGTEEAEKAALEAEEEAKKKLDKTLRFDLDEDDDDDDFDDEDENSEEAKYEYITPHYARNAILIGLLFIIIGFVGTHFVIREQMSANIREEYISIGYMLTDEATATAADIRQGKTAYVKGKLIEGTYVDIDTSFATATPSDILSGFTAYVNGKKITGSIPTYNGSTTFTPGKEDIVIPAGSYLRNNIIVRGEGNLISKYIASGISIFGVTGTCTGK